MQFVFELSLASAANKKLSANKQPKCIFFENTSVTTNIIFDTYGPALKNLLGVPIGNCKIKNQSATFLICNFHNESEFRLT